jgi:hypothetical protein
MLAKSASLLALLFAPVLALAQGAAQMRAASITTIAVGGTAVVAITGPVRGCYIVNPPLANESLFVDPITTAGLAASGTTSELVPGQPWSCPGQLPPGVAISVNAATAGHAFNAVVW